MAAVIPPLYIPAPAPGPLRYGLFTAARGPLEIEPHARAGGIQFEPDTCGAAHPYTATCDITEQATKVFDGSDVIVAQPYIAYASVVCKVVGHTPADLSRRATARLLAGEQTVVENVLWDGMGTGGTPTLTGSGAQVATTTATGFAARIGALEAAFYAEYGYQGTIHVNAAAAEVAAANHLVVQDGAIKRTHLGSVWSFGAGYGITGPDDAPPDGGSVYAFITPPVTIWRSSDILTPDPGQTFDRTNNDAYALAEREYVHALSCDTAWAIQLPLETAEGTPAAEGMTAGVEENV